MGERHLVSGERSILNGRVVEEEAEEWDLVILVCGFFVVLC